MRPIVSTQRCPLSFTYQDTLMSVLIFIDFYWFMHGMNLYIMFEVGGLRLPGPLKLVSLQPPQACICRNINGNMAIYLQIYHHVGRQSDGRSVGWTDRRSEGWSEGRPDGQTDGQTVGRTDGRRDGLTDGRTDGRSVRHSVCRTDRRTVRVA